MTRIIAYTFSADVHCPGCTRHQAEVGLLKREPPLQRETDEHDIATDLVDREGNAVHPVFSTDDREGLTHCGDCFAELT
jgi:hypothetical protein